MFNSNQLFLLRRMLSSSSSTTTGTIATNAAASASAVVGGGLASLPTQQQQQQQQQRGSGGGQSIPKLGLPVERRGRGGNKRIGSGPPKENLISQIVTVGRLSRMTTLGRVFSQRALVVVGDGKGKAGFGLGKDAMVKTAIDKALRDAKKDKVSIAFNADRSVFHDVEGKMNNTRVLIFRRGPEFGIKASKIVKAVLECAGIKNASAKVLDGRNPWTIVSATFRALAKQETPEDIYAKRGYRIKEF